MLKKWESFLSKRLLRSGFEEEIGLYGKIGIGQSAKVLEEFSVGILRLQSRYIRDSGS
jgi:hypothetical protein